MWVISSVGPAGIAGQALHLARDDRERSPGLAGPHRLDRGVEREDVGRLGDVVDVHRAAPDLLHRRGETGDVVGERVDQAQQLPDLPQRRVDLCGAFVEPLDRLRREQARLVARFGDHLLVGIEPGDGSLQGGVFGPQLLRGVDDVLQDAGNVGAANGNLAAALRNDVERNAVNAFEHFVLHRQ